MKTKRLLMAGAAISLFAACSNEIEMPAAGTNDANRPLAGEVVLKTSFDAQEGANTRAQWDENNASWIFSDPEDRFGVMLMDDWKGTNEGHTTIADYTFVDYIHTNYPFHSEDGGYTWKAPENSVLCEGNYFFSYPFNPKLTNRGYVYYNVPSYQYMQVIDKETGLPLAGDNEVKKENAVRNYQEYLGYAFIPASETVNEVNVKFRSLFANPKFKIQNLTGGDIRLIKLVIRTVENSDNAPKLMPTKLQLAPLSGNFAEKNALYPSMDTKEATAYMYSHATKVLDGIFGENKAEGTYEYVLDCGDEYVISNQEFIKLSAIMPAGDYKDFDVYAFVELPNSEKTTGVVRLSEVSQPSWTNMDTQGGAAPVELVPGVTQIYSASFDAGAIANLGVEKFTVASSKDLAWIIDLKAKNGGNETVVIKTLGEEVELDENVYALMSANNRKNIKWQINGAIVIPNDVPEDAIDLLTTDTYIKTTIINEGTQKLTKQVYADIVNKGTLTGNTTINGKVGNAEGAELDITTVKGDIENSGNITVKDVYGTVDTDNNATIETVNGNINNYNSRENAVLRIKNVTRTLTNTGKVVAEGGELDAVKNGYTISTSEITIEGETVINNLENGRWGKIEVKADSQIDGVNEGGTITVKEGVTFTPVFNAFENKDNGSIYVKNADFKYIEPGKKIWNNAYIYVIGKSHVMINGGEGIIDVTEANEEGGYQAASKTTETYFRYRGSVTDDILGKLISSNNTKNPVILEFEGNATQKALNANVTKILVKSGVTLALEGEWKLVNGSIAERGGLGDSYRALEIEKGAVLEVLNATILKAGSSFMTWCNGKFRAENTSKVLGTSAFRGEGVVEIATKDFEWKKDPRFTGTWSDMTQN